MNYEWKYGKRIINTDGWMYFIDNHPAWADLPEAIVAKLMDAHIATDYKIIVELDVLIPILQKGFVQNVRHVVRNMYEFDLNEYGHNVVWDGFGRYYIWHHDSNLIIEDAKGSIWQHWKGHEDNLSAQMLKQLQQAQ